jgi:apolipoprotein N-acyltransferase
VLFFAEKLVHQVGTFQFGTNDQPLRGRFAYGPAICYEVVFPQITAAQTRHGANVLVTVTNDAWFGHSAAPTQHLANARMRAIEDNRYLLRAATTGISAVIDPTGRVVESLPLDDEGIIMARFAPRQSRTAYVRFGDWMSVPFIVVLFGALAVEEVKRRKQRAA